MSENKEESMMTNELPPVENSTEAKALTPIEDTTDEVTTTTKAPVNDTIIESTKQEAPATKPNRELALLLKLSKEANLDTNIAHKRKTMHSDEDRNTPTKKLITGNDTAGESSERTGLKRRKSECSSDLGKNKRIKKDDDVDLSIIRDLEKDAFCWRCHKGGITIMCLTCPRSYHRKCLSSKVLLKVETWQCPECTNVLKAENVKTRSPSLQGMSIERLCTLLTFAHNRILAIEDIEPFMSPVNETVFPDYRTYIIQPMDLSKLLKNISDRVYGSTIAFEDDLKWILHNSVIFNSFQSKLTSKAKHITKVCRQEMSEIENCSNCYYNANTIVDWFVQICPKPHPLVWAKLKGFPYWPAKAMGVTASGQSVDVRFFGAHDRAWISSKNCYFYSQKNPNSTLIKKNEINECVKEVNIYIHNIKKKYGWFKYSRYKVPFDPANQESQFKEDKIRSSDVPAENKTDNEASEEEEKECNKSFIELYKSDNSYEENSKDGIENFTVEVDPMTVINTVLGCELMGKSFEESPKIEEENISETPKSAPNVNSLEEQKPLETVESFEDLKSPEEAITSQEPDCPKYLNSSDIPNSTERKKSPEKQDFPEKQKSPEKQDTTQKPYSPEKQKSPEKPNSPEKQKSPEKSNSLEDQKSSENPNCIDIQKFPEITISQEITKTSEKPKLSIKQKAAERKLKISDKLFQKFYKNRTKSESPESGLEGSADLTVKESINIVNEKIKKIARNNNSISKIIKQNDSDVKDNVEYNQENKQKPVEVVETIEQVSVGTEEEQAREQEDDLLDILYSEPITVSKKNKTTKSRSRNKEKPTINSPLKENLVINKPQEKALDNSEVVLLNSLLNENCLNKSSNIDITLIEKPKNVELKSSDSSEKPIEQPSIRLVSIEQLKRKLLIEDEMKQEPSSDSDLEVETANAKKELLTALNISEKPMFDSKVEDPLAINKSIRTPSRRLIMQNKKPPKVISESQKKIRKPKMKILTLTPKSTKDNESSNKSSEITQKDLTDQNNKNTSVLKKCNGNKRNTILDRNKKTNDLDNSPKTYRILNDSTGMFVEFVNNSNHLIETNDSFSISNDSSNSSSVINNSLTNKNESSKKTMETNKIVRSINEINRTTDTPYRCRSDIFIDTTNNGVNNGLNRTSTEMNKSFNINRSTPELKRASSTVTGINRGASGSKSDPIIVETYTDFNMLNGIVNEGISKAVSQFIQRQPPKLKPRPPYLLNNAYEDALPSTAGPITAKINSMAHKMSDFFRGMLIETIIEFGKNDNLEAEVVNLRLQIETDKHKHQEEIIELKKNINTILQDFQKSIVDEKEQIIQETRSACIQETIKRVDEAKLKQWCANCLKEAQFYCCWNTSYCDYPCQTKHWPKHESKCAQKQQKQNNTPTTLIKGPGAPIILRPAAPPGKNILNKPTKLVMNKTPVKQLPLNFAAVPGQIYFESRPGVYTNGPLINSNVLNKLKNCNMVTVTASPSNTSVPRTMMYQQAASTSDSRNNTMMVIPHKET